MLLDSQLLFSEELAVTAAANATNVYDAGDVRDIGAGEDLYVFGLVTTTMDDTGDDSTLTVNLVTDDNSALSSASVVQELFTFSATSPAGTILYAKISPEAATAFERYVGIAFAPAGGDLSAGAFTVGIVKDIQMIRNYASGFSIQ